MLEGESDKIARFLQRAIGELCGLESPAQAKVLDFGCGKGELVHKLLGLGYDAYGCDMDAYWSEEPEADAQRLAPIQSQPYRLPFEEGTFDVVLSTSVLEHARNKEECFREMHRVLKRGGYSMHMFPAKWYLPREPHIFVPLVNFFWPNCPRWWLGVWALAGVRNGFQEDQSWREVVEVNARYCAEGISYWSNRKYRRVSMEVFGNYSSPMEFYIRHAYGGFAKLCRRLPFKKLTGWISGNLRMSFILQQKT